MCPSKEAQKGEVCVLEIFSIPLGKCVQIQNFRDAVMEKEEFWTHHALYTLDFRASAAPKKGDERYSRFLHRTLPAVTSNN